MHLLPLAITLAAHAAHAAEPYTFQAAPLDDPARITWSTVHTACANAGARADDATLQPLRDACEAWSTLGDAAPPLPAADLVDKALAPAQGELAEADDVERGSAMSAKRPPLSQADLLLGLTDFLLERAETELRAWLIEVAFDKLCPDDGSFPFLADTCRVFGDPSTSLLTAGGEPLKAAITSDLRALIRRVPTWAQREFPGKLSADAQNVIGAAGRVVELTADRTPALDAIAGWSTDAHAAPSKDTPATTALTLVSLLISTGDLDGEALTLPDDPDTLLRDARLSAALDARRQHGTSTDPIGDALRALGDVKDAGREAQRALDAIARHVGALKDGWAATLAASKATDPAAARRAALAQLTDAALGILSDAIRHQRPDDPSLGWIDLARGVAGAVNHGDGGALWVELAQAAAELAALEINPDTKLGDIARRALGLASSLLGADGSADVQAALDTFAAPVGAWARKHDGPTVSAGLQAYVGVFGGTERAIGGSEWAGSFAPFVPVGFEVGGHDKRGVHAGLLVSAIDVGVLARWRIDTSKAADQDDAGDEDRDPKVRVQQVLAPGAWLTLAPGRAPIALGLGGSMSPDLVKIKADGELTTRTVDAFRLGAFVAVDLPIFP